MQVNSVLVLLLAFVVVAFSAPSPPYVQANLYPVAADGFETVWLDDMSFVTEININYWNSTNTTLYVYGDSRIRTVYPAKDKYYVGATPNENWHLPFIDFHTFQNGSDIWGIGPILTEITFQFEIAVITTKPILDNPRGRIFVEQPLGFEGTFYSVRVVGFDFDHVIGYFCGYFPTNSSTSTSIDFGVRRAHFNVSLFNGQAWNTSNDAWYFDPAIDQASLWPNAELVTYNSEFKPILLHARNVSADAPVNSTWLVVIDPYTNFANIIMGNYDQTVPLQKTGYTYVPIFGNYQFGQIVSAVVYQDLLFVGVSVNGVSYKKTRREGAKIGVTQGTGWIDVLYLANLTRKASAIVLPANYSDPRALVLDWYAPTPTLYVGMNGGASILRIDINSLSITGYQALPYYLHRTWKGVATADHVYFTTNEQHSKVYRVSKQDFCPKTCMLLGYCYQGKCVCPPQMVKVANTCQWQTIVQDRTLVKREKGGEIALGIFFAISTIAAIAGWYMVWKNKRGYQAVA